MIRQSPMVLKLSAAASSLFALAACSSQLSATAPAGALAAAGRPLAFVSVQGPAPDLARKFEAVLAQEARRRGFEIAGEGASASLKVKTYLDAYAAPDGKTGFSWVLETSDDGRTRSARVTGAAASAIAAGAPWQALDDAAMRQIAAAGLDDLVRQLQGAAAAPLTADEGQ